MKKKQFYLSETSGGVKILDKNTSFSDIHRGIIFKDLDSINQYMNGIYNTFLDKCYYPDLFSSIIKEELEPLKFKYFKYKNRIDRFKNKIRKYDYDWNRLDKLNKEFIQKQIEMTLVRLEFQEKLAIIWEEKTNREFSPFTRQIYTELEGKTFYTKDWLEAQEIINEWKKIKPHYENLFKKLKKEYSNKFNKCIDLADKRSFYKFQAKLPVLKTKYYELKYKLILSCPRADLLLKNKIFDISNLPINKIKYDGEGYNLFIVQEEKLKRIGYIIPYNQTYKLFSIDGILFNNNIKIILANEINGNKVNLKPYYSFHQTKTTRDRKSRKIDEKIL